MIRKAKALVRRIIYPPVHAPEIDLSYKVYGTDYGGWPLVDDSLNPDSVILSVGLGEDVSFDLEAIDRFGCTVVGCDPTPRSLAWLRGQDLPERFHVHALGLGEADGPVPFIPPAKDQHVSFSAARGKGQLGNAVEIEVCTLPTLLERTGLDRIDVLKMDIEGFEYGVVHQMAGTAIRPRQLLIEFHHRMYGYQPADTRHAIDKLRSVGYRIFYVSAGGHEYGLLHGPQ